MLKPYAAKLENIKSEITQIGIDVVDAMELSLRALEDKKLDDLKEFKQLGLAEMFAAAKNQPEENDRRFVRY